MIIMATRYMLIRITPAGEEKHQGPVNSKRDAATLRRILDDKFVASFGTEKPYDKEAFIKLLTTGDDFIESETLTDETVIVDHDTAVVVGTDTVRGKEKGTAYTVVYRYTVTHVRRNGQWLALAEHIVEVPQAK